MCYKYMNKTFPSFSEGTQVSLSCFQLSKSGALTTDGCTYNIKTEYAAEVNPGGLVLLHKLNDHIPPKSLLNDLV